MLAEENIPNLPCALRNKMSYLEAMSEKKQLEGISLGFPFPISGPQEKVFCLPLPRLVDADCQIPPLFLHTQKCL